MDSYHHHHHHHMMDADYGNIVYNSGQLANQLPPSDEMLLQNSQPVAKDIQYNETRESIIATNNIQQHVVYQQQHAPEQQTQPQSMVLQQQQIENGQTTENYNQYIHPIEQQQQQQQQQHQQQQLQPQNEEAIPPENPTFKTEQFKTETDYCENEENEATTNSLENNPVAPINDNVGENESQIEAAPANIDGDVVPPDAQMTTSINNELDNATVTTPTVKDNEIDPNQCRICLAKENLVNIFIYENKIYICDMITAICPTVKIVVKDYLPQFICANCLEKVKIAHEFKIACETTDRELRLNLKRSKNKIRGGSSRYLLVDCELSSDSDANKNNEDDEFKLSNDDSDSDVSFKLGKKKKKSSGKSKKRSSSSSHRKRGSRGDTKEMSSKSKSRSTRTSNRIQPPSVTIPIDVVYVEAARIVNRGTADDKDDDDDSDAAPLSSRRSKRSSNRNRSKSSKTSKKSKPPGPKSATTPSKPAATTTAGAESATTSASSSKVPHKKRKHISTVENSSDETASKKSSGGTPSSAQRERKERPCDLCDLVFTSWQSFKDHRKAHKGEKPLVCHICNRPFKQRVSLDAHVRKHMEDETRMCKQCNNKQFASRLELRKHQQSVHEAEFTFECDKCKRTFTSEARLNTHKDGKCPGFDTSQRKKPEVEVSANLGRDLFKCVAPVTSTYWSDEFSE